MNNMLVARTSTRLLIFTFLIASFYAYGSSEMYFVTVSDTEHFPWLQGLIESILKYNYVSTAHIAVFDLGLTPNQIDELNRIKTVRVYDIENANAEMRQKFEVRRSGRLARRWYSWKPAVFRQALELFPYFLYIDAGIEVMAPLDAIFDEIQKEGYYLYDCPHLIFPVVTDYVAELFKLDNPENSWILEENCISGALQGISRSLLDSYVEPMYQLASDIKNFQDDGTAAWGYGFARHDQVLFSIFVRQLGLKVHPLNCNPRKIRVGDQKIYFGVLKHFKLRKHTEKDARLLQHARIHKLLG